MTLQLFVYGTLRPGLAPPQVAALAARFTVLGPAWIVGRLYDLGPYPGAVLAEGPGARVRGLLVRLPGGPETLRRLDEYEGHDSRNPARSVFLRTEAAVHLEAGGETRAWIYVWNRDPGDAPEIPDGDYPAYRETRRERLPEGAAEAAGPAGKVDTPRRES